MLDSKFTFSIRAEQVNQARFGASLTYVPGAFGTGSQLQIRQIAGAAVGIEGVTQTKYTDSTSNTANINLEAAVTAGTFNMAAFQNHSLNLLRFTDPGPPVPSVYYDSSVPDYANHTFEFHGTCKPATFGDYVNHTSMDAARGGVASGFDNHFVTAGFDPTINPPIGIIAINVNNIAMPTTTTITPNVVASINSNFPANSINSTNQLRLFTHPNYVDDSNPNIAIVLLIGWNGFDIYLENYYWDGFSINPYSNSTISTSNNMFYRGQHDIHYLNNGNILLQTWDAARTSGLLYEIDGQSLMYVMSETTTCVAYDPVNDVIGVRKGNAFQTYSGNLSTPGSSKANVFQLGSIAYDAIYHPDEPLTMYVGERIPGTPGSLVGHVYNYNSSGGGVDGVSFTQSLDGQYPEFTQIERTSPNVLMNSVGPGNGGTQPVRTVCTTATYKGVSPAIVYTSSVGSYSYEDITQMRHPLSQDYKLTITSVDTTIKGNNHLIGSTYDSQVACWGQNYCKKHWEKTNTSGGVSSHHIYILYLGYYLDPGAGKDGYAYIVVTGVNSTFGQGMLAPTGPGTSPGLIHWVNFRE
jgi:hypothetical protein